jgi:hypothetical protein
MGTTQHGSQYAAANLVQHAIRTELGRRARSRIFVGQQRSSS